MRPPEWVGARSTHANVIAYARLAAPSNPGRRAHRAMIRHYLISRSGGFGDAMRLLQLLVLWLSPLLVASQSYASSEPPPTPRQFLQCYHCINRLSTVDISKQEQSALKSALFARFNIPPSSEYCAVGGSDVLFRAVPKESCVGVNDSCVRFVSEGDETKKLVLRGCQSTLLKAQFELDTNYSCQNGGSECISTCREPLCNTHTAPFRGILGPVQVLIVVWLRLV